MDIVMNGKAVCVVEPISVLDLLRQHGLEGKRLAVELNGEIVPKSQHAQISLKNGDKLEIVLAVGGG